MHRLKAARLAELETDIPLYVVARRFVRKVDQQLDAVGCHDLTL
jgi:hypothetical protein